ncbi:uncharacterized protein LOC100252636 isoform X1 [Vitis vinifera]|uniref:Uncharacterized protein n=1 Tax=Vitis vinifera TaxID=29760 RepID=D7SU37_VITVI|eukprot:XP_002282937.1 PREDICTED: uncharacterized protein LOC100252636 isoform X1 [Vitis vinifera]
MDPWKLLESTEVVLFEDKSLVEELRELRKLRTAVMVEKCLGQNDVVTCPKPRRQQIRQCGGHIDAKVGAELSDIITSKASPPYYSVSPPIRAGNPLVQDARFLQQWGSQGAVHGTQTEGFHRATHRTQRTRSVSTMA